MNTSIKFQDKIRRKLKKAINPNSVALAPSSVSKKDKNERLYKTKVIAVEFFEYFKSKGNVFITQDEILKKFMKDGWSKSYVYLKLKKFSQGIVKRTIGSDKLDIFEPLLLEISRLEIDNKQGICYKLNDCWKEVKVEEIAKAFHGK